MAMYLGCRKTAKLLDSDSESIGLWICNRVDVDPQWTSQEKILLPLRDVPRPLLFIGPRAEGDKWGRGSGAFGESPPALGRRTVIAIHFSPPPCPRGLSSAQDTDQFFVFVSLQLLATSAAWVSNRGFC